MSVRNYNKLYVHRDREEGSGKILLGYQNDTREILLYKNTETLLHIPFYTEPIRLADSTLIRDGATAGPFPAASDRIFKNHKNYGNVTANGTPTTLADGGWFCSWLYKDEIGNVKWMDRYYNPGRFIVTAATAQLAQAPYVAHNPVFRDEPSTMLFEAGVQYRYFHVGEETAQELVTTYGGVSGEHLPLDLSHWGSDIVDASNNPKKVKIITNGSLSDLYTTYIDSDHVYAPSISFDNIYNTEVSIEHDSSYNLIHEFSWAFWAHSNDWKNCPSTQLIGNFSSKGGIGLFLDTLSSYPFFVIPETGYGHLLFVNEKLNQFLDKSVQLTTSLTATPHLIGIDSDHNVIVCNSDSSRLINKYDNAGEVLATATLPSLTEDLKQLICGPNDTFVVITDRARYTYDTNLVLTKTTFWNTTPTTIAAYAYDEELGSSELISFDGVNDSKFIGMTHWCLSAADGNLYRRSPDMEGYQLVGQFDENATDFGIDPYDRLWVLHGTNNVSVYSSQATSLTSPLFTFTVGKNVTHEKKNISFICTYDRVTNTREWKCLIYYFDGADLDISPELYVIDLNGFILETINILSLFDLNLFRLLNQQQKELKFSAKGDFTGYEHRRVFNKLAPYNNTPQLILKTSLKDKTKTTLPYTQFKDYTSIGSWDSKCWQHIVLTLRNRSFNLYINGKYTNEVSYSGQYEISYETQPTFFIGSPGGSRYGFNREIGNPSCLFNGKIQDVKVYDYALDPKNLEMYLRASIPAQNIYWSLPTSLIQYIEKIERMFKNKIPGSKSTYFNIKLCGTTISDLQTRTIIEDQIRTLISEIKPAYTDFLKVQWVD